MSCVGLLLNGWFLWKFSGGRGASKKIPEKKIPEKSGRKKISFSHFSKMRK